MSAGVIAASYVAVVLPPYPTQVMADNPLAYWRLGEVSGTTATDFSPNARHGIYPATKTATPGLLVGDTDGAANQRATVADGAWMNVNAITVECLIKPSSVNNNGGIVARFQVAQDWILWANTGSQIAVRFYNTGGSQVNLAWATVPTNGTVYHVAATYTSGQAVLYINGVAVASSTALTGNLNATNEHIDIRSYQDGQWNFAGVIDEVAIYGAALSASRIAAHYAASI